MSASEDFVYLVLDAGDIVSIHRTKKGAKKERQRRVIKEIENFHRDINLDNYNLTPEERKLAELFKLDETPAKLKEDPEQFRQRVEQWYTIDKRFLKK